MRTSTLSLILMAAVSGAACFKPNIADGGFRCAQGSTPCPDGFRCEPSSGLCKKHPGAGGGSGQSGGGGAAGAGGISGASGGGGGGGQLPCFAPKPSCDPTDAGICDPYCQAGCAGCRDKCSVNTDGDLTCNAPTKTTLAGTLEPCSISNRGSSLQADDCAPSNVCVDIDVCFPRCFRFCRADQDCDNAFCDRTVTDGGQKVCGLPYVDTCSPLMVPGNTGCGVGMACYLSATHSEHTFCDCPQSDGRIGDACTRSRDCNPGLTCAYVLSDAGQATCRQVCELSNDGAECILPTTTCQSYRGASGNEAPNARWGFCI